MRMDALIAEMATLDVITAADLDRWERQTGLGRSALPDAVARYLAYGFNEDTISFPVCDAIVNRLMELAVAEGPPGVFWEIYLAFDAGEYYRDGDRSIDPIEAYTRPLIADFVARDRNGSIP